MLGDRARDTRNPPLRYTAGRSPTCRLLSQRPGRLTAICCLGDTSRRDWGPLVALRGTA